MIKVQKSKHIILLKTDDDRWNCVQILLWVNFSLDAGNVCQV